MCPSVILAESVILPIMLNKKIMNPSYGGNKSGACFIEMKCASTFYVAVGSGINHTPRARVEQWPLVSK